MKPEFLRVVVIGAVLLVFLLTAVMDRERRKGGTAFLLGWLVPGLGHLLLGRWRKALFFFLAIGGVYVGGLWLTGFRMVGFDDNPFYFVGQYGSGLTMLLGHLLGGTRAYRGAVPLEEKAFPRPDLPLGLYDPGLLYVCVAGLLNLVVALNCLEGKGAAEPAKSAPAEGKGAAS